MQKKIIILLIIIMAFGVNLVAKELELGEKLKLEKATNVSEILEKPADFLDKAVRVEGYIVDGCKHHGTWIAIAGDKEFQKIAALDKEGKITFPLDHRGKYAIVEGTVFAQNYTEEQAIKWLQHLAETHKQEVDLSKAKGGMKVYKINVSGAVVKDSK